MFFCAWPLAIGLDALPRLHSRQGRGASFSWRSQMCILYGPVLKALKKGSHLARCVFIIWNMFRGPLVERICVGKHSSEGPFFIWKFRSKLFFLLFSLFEREVQQETGRKGGGGGAKLYNYYYTLTTQEALHLYTFQSRMELAHTPHGYTLQLYGSPLLCYLGNQKSNYT